MTQYQLMPALSEEEYTALKKDIAERGILVPIEVDENGAILDGHHRLQAWEELKAEGVELPDYARVIRAGLTEEQKRNHIRALNILRRHLSKEQRKEQWAEMRKDGMSYREIAEVSGVDASTVYRSGVANATPQPETVTGKDGKEYPAKKKPPKKDSLPEAATVSIFAQSEVAEEKAKVKAQKIVEAGSEGARQVVHATMFSHESKEYYTPSEYIELAREVMGGIDLDPASHDIPQEWIQAKVYYTAGDDGLNKPWFGRVWLNPPYGKEGGDSNQMLWSQHTIAEYEAGRIEAGIVLVKAALGYKWFEELWYDWPVCFARERLSYILHDRSNDGQSKQGSAFFYIGPDVERFRDIFRQIGRVIMPEVEE